MSASLVGSEMCIRDRWRRWSATSLSRISRRVLISKAALGAPRARPPSTPPPLGGRRGAGGPLPLDPGHPGRRRGP
eukprot:5333372-Alexandrium_andersonii.AAC.1